MKKAIVIDPIYKDKYDKEYIIDSIFYRVNFLNTLSKWYRLKEKQDDIICFTIGSKQIKIL